MSDFARDFSMTGAFVRHVSLSMVPEILDTIGRSQGTSFHSLSRHDEKEGIMQQ